tara:strand:+ start:52 stop:795 length:744 start_codon:yes stop_codon:yes gene_type:complete
MSLSIIVPTLNEQKTLYETLTQLKYLTQKYIKNNDYEIIIIDDNSVDYTYSEFKRFRENNDSNNFFFYKNPSKPSLAKSIKYGVSLTKFDSIACIDADLSFDPEYILQNINLMENYDFINFSRYLEKNNDKRTVMNTGLLKYFSFLINKMMKLSISGSITDYTSGFFLSKSKIIKNYEFKGNYGEYYMFLITNVIISDYKIKEIPVMFYDRLAGESKTGKAFLQIFSTGVPYFKTLIEILLKKYFKL